MPRTNSSRRTDLSRFLITAILLSMPFAAQTQTDEYDPPGRVARLRWLQGAVSFQPAGDSDWVAASVNRPTTTGDRLWTDSGSRAELGIGSATLRLAASTGFSFLDLSDRTVQIELTQGMLDVRVRRLGPDEVFEVDTPNQAFTLLRPGLYRIEAAEDGYRTYVTVRDGGAGEATGGGSVYTVVSGQTVTLTGTDRLRAEIADAGDMDEFARWGQARDRHDDRSRSARYVSRDVVGYEDLDDYGTWRSYPDYGNVWVPSRMAMDWAPYRDGHWAWVSPWGWTWVDDEPWGYAPFHYGRWVHVRGSWGWVPGPVTVQAVYAPALVAFVGGPGFGLSASVGGGGYAGNVAWFPLAPREVYVPAYRVSPAYLQRVNVSNTAVGTTTITTVYNTQVASSFSTTNITYVNRTVPGGVTAVPHAAFTSAQPVARATVPVDARQVASAPVGSRVAVAPTRASILGIRASTAGSAPRPPAAIAMRPVVVRSTPPPPPVPFASQQRELAAHPGQPLARHEVERLRPADRDSLRPLVKQSPPGKPATPERIRAQPSPQPGAQPSPQPRAQQGPQSLQRTEPRPSATQQPSRSPPPSPSTGSAPQAQPRERSVAATGALRPPGPQNDRPTKAKSQAAPGESSRTPTEREREEREGR